MSIKFDPFQNNIQLNNKDAEYFSEPNQSIDDCYVDMYVLQLNDQSDSEILKILKNTNANTNVKLIMIDRCSKKEIVKEYKDGVEISKPYYGSNDIYISCLDEITKEINVDKICLDIYKNHIEKYVLTRSNKYGYHNNLYKDIYDKMKFYFEETIKCSNVKLHLVYVKSKSSEYLSSCIIS